MAKYNNTTVLVVDTKQRGINLYVPIPIVSELDSLQCTTRNTRSEMIRTAIRSYIKKIKDQLLDEELKFLSLHNLRKEK